MGGYGSGRWGWSHTRETTDGLLWLDVRDLARRGLFAAGPGQIATGSIAWSRRGETTDWIRVACAGDEPDTVLLDYQTWRPGEAWKPVRERVLIERTPCRYGGSRPWFRCSRCGSRRAVLYSVGGHFRCRACHDLAYGSTRDADHARAQRRAATLRRRLGGSESGWRSVPDKPKGMQWRTYERIAAGIRMAEHDALAAWAAHAESFIAQLDRKGKGRHE